MEGVKNDRGDMLQYAAKCFFNAPSRQRGGSAAAPRRAGGRGSAGMARCEIFAKAEGQRRRTVAVGASL